MRFQVLLQQLVLRKNFDANRTLVLRRINAVNPEPMPLQIDAKHIGPAAAVDLAHVRLLAAMHARVGPQLCLTAKRLGAHLAFVRFFARVRIDVLVQIVQLIEAAPAIRAHKRLALQVNAFVRAQVAGRRKHFAAFRAGGSFGQLRRVHVPHVALQGDERSQFLLANATAHLAGRPMVDCELGRCLALRVIRGFFGGRRFGEQGFGFLVSRLWWLCAGLWVDFGAEVIGRLLALN